MQFKDQMNTVFELKSTPKRIICLVPSITELLVDLGLTSSIIGITKFCVHPKELRKEKAIVGGTKNIKIDKITSLQPDFIICNKEENTKEIVNSCQLITTTYVSDICSLEDTLTLIHQFGQLFSCIEEAEEIIIRFVEKYNNFSDFIHPQPMLKVVYFIWKNPWMVAANHTFINHLLKINKFNNAFKNKERYPEINLKELTEIDNIDVILLSSEPYPFHKKDILNLQQQFPKIKIVLVDGESFSWYGTRLFKALDYFRQLRIVLNSSLSI